MSLTARLKRLWDLSGINVEIFSEPVEQIDTGFSFHGIPIKRDKKIEPASFIPHNKVDPVKEITEENV